MAWNDWKAAMKDGLSSFKWNPKPAAEAAEAYMRSELKRTGQLPTGEPPPQRAMWNPISEERQRALAASEAGRVASPSSRVAETSPMERISTGPWNAHRDAPDTRTRYTVGLSTEGFHFSHETQSPRGLNVTPWSEALSMDGVERAANRSQQRIVAPDQPSVSSQPKAEPLSMSAFSKGMLEETGKMDRGRGQQELSLPSAARGRGRGPSL